MNVLDANLVWIKRDEREIPMMTAVYGGYSLYFGSPHAFDVSDRSWVMSQGRDFLFGSQNGWVGINLYSDPKYSAKAEYMRKIGQYRIANKKFLTYGELMDEIRPTAPVEDITENWPTHRGSPKDATIPSVMGTVWKSEDGHIGIFIANYLDEETSFSYRLDLDKYNVRASESQEYEMSLITPESREIMGYHYPGPVIRTEDLGPREIRVIEIAVVGKTTSGG